MADEPAFSVVRSVYAFSNEVVAKVISLLTIALYFSIASSIAAGFIVDSAGLIAVGSLDDGSVLIVSSIFYISFPTTRDP